MRRRTPRVLEARLGSCALCGSGANRVGIRVYLFYFRAGTTIGIQTAVLNKQNYLPPQSRDSESCMRPCIRSTAGLGALRLPDRWLLPLLLPLTQPLTSLSWSSRHEKKRKALNPTDFWRGGKAGYFPNTKIPNIRFHSSRHPFRVLCVQREQENRRWRGGGGQIYKKEHSPPPYLGPPGGATREQTRQLLLRGDPPAGTLPIRPALSPTFGPRFWPCASLD